MIKAWFHRSVANLSGWAAAGIAAWLICMPAAASGEPLPGNPYGGATALALAEEPDDPFNAAGQLRSGIAAFNKGDYPEAFRKFRNISTLGIPEAEFRLGLMYAAGLGVQKNPRLAAFWLRQAAQQRFPGASDALASLRPDA